MAKQTIYLDVLGSCLICVAVGAALTSAIDWRIIAAFSMGIGGLMQGYAQIKFRQHRTPAAPKEG